LSAKFGLGIKAVRPEGVFLFPKFGTQMALKNEYSLDFLTVRRCGSFVSKQKNEDDFKRKRLFPESLLDSK
jgi:hypothetical protein